MKILLATSFFMAGMASAQVKQNAPANPYYDCLAGNVAKYAPKANNAEEAISASRAACIGERENLMADAVTESLKKGRSGPQAEETAVLALKKLDERLHDELVKKYLESRQ